MLDLVTKNWRTSFMGLILFVALVLYSLKFISTAEFLSVGAFVNSLGLFLSKDGQTRKEYRRKHKKIISPLKIIHNGYRANTGKNKK